MLQNVLILVANELCYGVVCESSYVAGPVAFTLDA